MKWIIVIYPLLGSATPTHHFTVPQFPTQEKCDTVRQTSESRMAANTGGLPFRSQCESPQAAEFPPPEEFPPPDYWRRVPCIDIIATKYPTGWTINGIPYRIVEKYRGYCELVVDEEAMQAKTAPPPL